MDIWCESCKTAGKRVRAVVFIDVSQDSRKKNLIPVCTRNDLPQEVPLEEGMESWRNQILNEVQSS